MKTSDILAGGIYATAESNPSLFIVLSTDVFEQPGSKYGAVRRVTSGQSRYSGTRYGALVAESISLIPRYGTPAEEAAALTELAASVTVLSTDVWPPFELANGTGQSFTLADGRRAGFRLRVMTTQQFGMALSDYEESVREITIATVARMAERAAVRTQRDSQFDEIKTLLGVGPGDATSFNHYGSELLTVTTGELLALVRKVTGV